jgi:transcriptional regulator with XRE-family HTH domain
MGVRTLASQLRYVEEAHDALGLTYRQLAAAIGADESTLHRWRSGESEPRSIFLSRMDALRVPAGASRRRAARQGARVAPTERTLLGSLGTEGRFNPTGEFGALYVSLDPETPFRELRRQAVNGPDRTGAIA